LSAENQSSVCSSVDGFAWICEESIDLMEANVGKWNRKSKIKHKNSNHVIMRSLIGCAEERRFTVVCKKVHFIHWDVGLAFGPIILFMMCLVQTNFPNMWLY
jgi:hypothetical protein